MSRTPAFRVLLIPTLVLGLAGCGGEATTVAEAPAPASEAIEPTGPRVMELEEGQSGRVLATAFYRDANGRLWLDAEARLLPKRLDDGSMPDPGSSARVVAAMGRLQLGLDLTDPVHLVPRDRPREARWVEAIDLAALVGQIRGGDFRAAER